MPLRAPDLKMPTYLNQVADVEPITHADRSRPLSVATRAWMSMSRPTGEDIGSPPKKFQDHRQHQACRRTSESNVRGLVVTMQSSFKSFGVGLLLAILLVYLILVAQFASFVDPFLIVLAVPTGLVGVILTLAFTGTTLNIQSLMGIVMLQGMVVSNSILIVDFANRAAHRRTQCCAKPSRMPAASGCGRF